jgi:hypothetical protein
MAPDLCLEDAVGDTTEKFGDRKIWQLRPFAINLPVAKSFGRMFAPRLTNEKGFFPDSWHLFRARKTTLVIRPKNLVTEKFSRCARLRLIFLSQNLSVECLRHG